MDRLTHALDQRAEAGQPVRFWLRDDDAVAPTPALDALLAVTGDLGIPATLAVIPKFTGQDLADRLAEAGHVTVAVHGWAHVNHAEAGEKKQELGRHRPLAAVAQELRAGFAHLQQVFPARFVPVLVPPWNRIAPEVVAELPGLGFRALSTFGPAKPGPLPVINTDVDLIDWHGNRGGRPDADLVADICAAIDKGGPVGLLTHHLVHDAQAWGFLERFLTLTAGHSACQWTGLRDLVPLPGFPANQQSQIR